MSVINQQLHAFVCPEFIDNEYLAYWLETQKLYMESVASKTTILYLNKANCESIPVAYPRLPEQQKISQILSTWDKAIDKLEALIAAKQKRKKALMQRLLTRKIRFSDFNGGWQYLKADELFKPVSKKANGDKDELLAVTQDQGVLPRNLLDRRVVMPDGNTEGYKLVVSGDFIISLRSFQGGLEYSNCRGLVSPAYTVLQPIIKICADFYRHYFKSYDFIGHLAVAVIGIRDGKQISYSDFSFLKLPYPPIEEQQKIAAVLSAADNEITIHQNQLAALKQQKKGLMQQLLTGKKRVNVNQAAA
jgi:type I restriction enzyme S subunit